jgi:excisionase family DNA binding protein
MSNFVSLDEAAKKLGVSAESLVEMLSRGEIFGYRDGGSWKFKPQEIERVASEMLGDVLDEDPAGSSILVSESALGSSSSQGSTIGSDIKLAEDDPDSDVALVPDSMGGSDVRLVARTDDATELPSSDDDDDELSLESSNDDDILAAISSTHGSDVELDGLSGLNIGSDIGSDVPLSGELNLAASAEESDLRLASDSGLIKGGSDPSMDGLDLQIGGDLELTDDGDLVLGGGSDLALGSDSGINLMSPSDSGISLEDEPLDLAASGISGLDLASDGSDVSDASGSAVDFQQDEEFQLSPSGALEVDDDSGSQVIELEDSSEFGDAAVALPTDDAFDAFADVDSGGAIESGDAFGETAPAGAAVMMGVPEVPYSLLQVLSLLGILLLMCLSGILMSDVVRNMWASADVASPLTSSFTDMVLSAFGQK